MEAKATLTRVIDAKRAAEARGRNSPAGYLTHARLPAAQMIEMAHQGEPLVEVPLNLHQSGSSASDGRAWLSRAVFSLGVLVLASQLVTYLLGS